MIRNGVASHVLLFSLKTCEVIATSADFGQYGWCYDRLSTMIRREGIMFGEHLDEILAKLYELGFHEDNDYWSAVMQ